MRQQLKETNLDSEKDGSARANRKRSLDNTDGATDTPPTKRSRECTPDNTTQDNSNHAGISKDAITQDVSDYVLPTAPANTSVHNTRLSHNPTMSHIPETTKLQFPLELEINVSIGGCEQITHVTIPVEIGIKVTAGMISASQTSRPAECESSKINITIPSAKPIPPSGPSSPGPSSPGASSPVQPSPGQSPEHAQPSLGEHVHGRRSPESYIYDDPSFHIYEEPESIGDSSSEDSLPDYRSPEYPSSPPVPHSPTNPDYPKPMVQVIDSDHSQPPQSLETTARGNEDESSQTLKKKRSREQLEDDASKYSHTATDPAPGLTETTSDEKSTAEGQPDKKRPRDNSEERKAKVDQVSLLSQLARLFFFYLPLTLLLDFYG